MNPNPDWHAKLAREARLAERRRGRRGGRRRGGSLSPARGLSPARAHSPGRSGRGRPAEGPWWAGGAQASPPPPAGGSSLFGGDPGAYEEYLVLSTCFRAWARYVWTAHASRAAEEIAIENWLIAVAFWERYALRRVFRAWRGRNTGLLRRAMGFWFGRSLSACFVAWRSAVRSSGQRQAEVYSAAMGRLLQRAMCAWREASGKQARVRRALRTALAFWQVRWRSLVVKNLGGGGAGRHLGISLPMVRLVRCLPTDLGTRVVGRWETGGNDASAPPAATPSLLVCRVVPSEPRGPPGATRWASAARS